MTIGDELAATLRAAAEEHHLPGAAAGVLVDDESHTAAYGVTNVEYPQAVSAASLFQVGSITKTFTSAAVMLLVEDGRLALDDPVARHLPDLAASTGLDLEAITVERALSHQAGFDGDHLFVGRVTHDLDALADARRLFPPGTGFSYNNAGFSIAGALIEAVARRPFESFVRERLLLPLGLVSAAFTADDAITYPVTAPHWVTPEAAYVLRGAGWQPGWELGPLDRAAGGLIASVEHLLEWCRFQQTGAAIDGAQILSRGSLDRLHAPVVNADRLDDIALDWFVRALDGVTSIGHGGLTVGYASDLLVVPERAFAFVGLTNGTNGGSVNQAVRRWALERFAGIRERDPVQDPSVAVDPARFVGEYWHPFAALTVTAGDASGTVVVRASRRGDAVAWQPPLDPPITCAFFAEDHAVSLDAPGPARVARFGFDDGDHRAAWMLWSSRRAVRTA